MPEAVPTRRAALRSGLEVLSAVLLVAAVATIGISGWIAVNDSARAAAATPPGPDTLVVAARDSVSAVAADSPDATDEQRAAAAYLAEQPSAYWLTPEATDDTAASALVLSLAQEARDQHASLALVVYGIPGRDCGSFSDGGSADAAAYDRWTASIGAALRSVPDVRALVFVEPDSLALAAECGDVDQRVAELQTAVDNLAAPHVFLYLDGGHSLWSTPADMAALLQRVGRGDVVRGFATNVANYQPTAAEVEYAHAVAARLPAGAHAIVDTSRNGLETATTEWCNPPGQLVGEQGGVGDDVVDAALWVKPPGESDGTCNGGPAAGTWWPQSAVELTRRAR